MRKKLLAIIILTSVLFFSCVKDRVTGPITTPPVGVGSRVLIDYWNFNNAASLAALITPTYTIYGASLSFDFATVSGSTGYYDSVASTAGTINAQSIDTTEGEALRVRNPSTDMIITAPTTNHKDILLSYAVEASSVGSGAVTDSIWYTTDGVTYTNAGLSNITYSLVNYIDPNYALETFDFTSITAANNNPNFKIKISFASGNLNTSGNDRFDNITIFADSIPASNVPVVSSAASVSGNIGTAFTYTIAASNTPASYAVTGTTGLPPGLSVNTSTGVISGTPTIVGTYIDTVKAINTSGTGTKVVTITIAANNVPVVSSSASVTDTVGNTALYTIVASNTPTSYTVTGTAGVPPGLSVNTSTGVISGTPTTSGTYIDTLNATNASGTGKRVLTITVSPAVQVLLHYWNFNTSSTTATSTIGGGAISFAFDTVLSYGVDTIGYYDFTTSHTTQNAQNGDVAGEMLRVRNPSNYMIITAPTPNYKNIMLSYAVGVSSTTSAALTDSIYYTTDGINFINAGLSSPSFDLTNYIDPTDALETVDFSSIAAVNNNPNFAIKIVFANGNLHTSGNDRFDNITVIGVQQ